MAEIKVGIGPYSPIGDLVGASVVVVSADTPLVEAARLMRRQDVSSVLVDDGHAILTERDITDAVATGMDPQTAVMLVAHRDPVCASAESTVVAATALMLAGGVRHLVVTRGDAVVGVVSLRPLVGVLVEAMDPGVWFVLHKTVHTETEQWIG
jgi:CBS domain-containing protein